jgi:hypothetical protein
VKRGDAASTPLVSLAEFKDFVRRVVAVPKKEIDRKLAAQRQRRAVKRGRRKG